jgi:hypothetical protein
MIFWLSLATLWIFSIGGAIYFRGERSVQHWSRYRSFIYACAILFAALPLTSGDWRWSLPLLPLALGRLRSTRDTRVVDLLSATASSVSAPVSQAALPANRPLQQTNAPSAIVSEGHRRAFAAERQDVMPRPDHRERSDVMMVRVASEIRLAEMFSSRVSRCTRHERTGAARHSAVE